MKTRAVRLHGANDLRLMEFELPEIRDDEILVKVVSDSICMSTYKCALLGVKHKRVQPDVADVAILRRAQEHPEEYPTLSVRVSGWNARFVTLNREWQDMIIERTSGGAV